MKNQFSKQKKLSLNQNMDIMKTVTTYKFFGFTYWTRTEISPCKVEQVTDI